MREHLGVYHPAPWHFPGAALLRRPGWHGLNCPPVLQMAPGLPMVRTMHVTTAQRHQELSAIATSTVHLVDQIARGYRYAYVATCPLVGCVLDELGLVVTLVQGNFRGQSHSWLEADSFSVDPAREYFDGGALVEPLRSPSPYVAEQRLPIDW